MAKFCGHCGAEMADEVKVCGACGIPFGEETAPAQERPIEATPAAPVEEKKRGDFSLDKKFLPVIGAAAVAFIAVIVLLISLIFSGGYKTAVDNYLDVVARGKVSKLDDLAPKAYWEWYEDEYDKDFDDIKEEYEDNVDDMLDELEDEYGKRIRVSYKVEDKDALSKKKLEKLAEALNDRYDIKESSVKKAYELELEMTIKGSEDDEDTEITLTVVKIGSEWYPISFYEYNDNYVVNFLGI